jgi:hypothetical protein
VLLGDVEEDQTRVVQQLLTCAAFVLGVVHALEVDPPPKSVNAHGRRAIVLELECRMLVWRRAACDHPTDGGHLGDTDRTDSRLPQTASTTSWGDIVEPPASCASSRRVSPMRLRNVGPRESKIVGRSFAAVLTCVRS